MAKAAVHYRILQYILLMSCFCCTFGLRSSKGTEFLVVFPKAFVDSLGDWDYNRIYISAENAASVIVSSPATTIQALSVAARTTQGVIFRQSTVDLRVTSGKESKVVLVTSDVDVTVHSTIQGLYSSDGTLVFPTSILGTEYVIGSVAGYLGYSVQIAVTPITSNSTIVFKDPSGTIQDSASVNYLQTYTYSSTNVSLTGWTVGVTSGSAVAVFIGVECAWITDTQSPSANTNSLYSLQGCDALYEALPPTEFLSTEYVIFHPRTLDVSSSKFFPTSSIHRVVTTQAGCTVSDTATQSTRTLTGSPDSVDLELNSTYPASVLTCSCPCSVSLLTPSSSSTYNTYRADPSMTSYVPTEYHDGLFMMPVLYASRFPTRDDPFQVLSVAVVALTTDKAALIINGINFNAAADHWEDITGTNYSVGYYKYFSPSADVIVEHATGGMFTAYAFFATEDEVSALSGGWGGLPDVPTTGYTTAAAATTQGSTAAVTQTAQNTTTSGGDGTSSAGSPFWVYIIVALAVLILIGVIICIIFLFNRCNRKNAQVDEDRTLNTDGGGDGGKDPRSGRDERDNGREKSSSSSRDSGVESLMFGNLEITGAYNMWVVEKDKQRSGEMKKETHMMYLPEEPVYDV